MIDIIIIASLSIIMFGLGLNMDFSNFRHHFTKPKALIIGVLCQILLTPIIAYSIIYILNIDAHYAFGIMLLAAVPGGTTSAIITHWVNGDTALSVSLTSISGIIITFLSLPTIIYFSSTIFLQEESSTSIDSINIISKLIFTIILPIVSALILKKYKSELAARLYYVLNYVIVAYYAIMIIVGVIILVNNLDMLSKSWEELIVACLTLHFTMLLLGYLSSSIANLNSKETKTISIESAFQNNNLAIALAITVIQIEAVAIPSIAYGLIMAVTGLLLVVLEKVKKPNTHINSGLSK